MAHFMRVVRALKRRLLGRRRNPVINWLARAWASFAPDYTAASATQSFPWNAGTPPVVSPVLADPTIGEQPFMPYSTCSAADFFHPRFSEISQLLNSPVALHRKYWEWVYIVHTALDRGLAAPGKRALGFGVGQEAIPAVLAKLGTQVTATDAPEEIGVGQGWYSGREYAGDAQQLTYAGIIDKEQFLQNVRYFQVDMNAIDPDLIGFDFCWSSCALEHLGTLQKGLDFILHTVENCLKPGGIACHTTEYNLSSDSQTVEAGSTVIYRRRDIEALIHELRKRGHRVADLNLAPDAHLVDRYVDVPPYSPHGHLKLLLEGYAATSLALVIQRAG